MDITISGPAGSGKTRLAAYIWPWFEGKRSLVQVHAFPKDAVKQCKTWHAVDAGVIVWDGCLSALIDRVQAQNIMQHYRETYNPNAVAIYVIQQ
jgi:ABC-type dipeptide/oligopeptide/nickel transport system ATPase subunit